MNQDFGSVYTASVQHGKRYDLIIIPHSNKIELSRCGNCFRITLRDRILVHGRRPRSGTVAAIKLLEAIRVNTHSIMIIHPYDDRDGALRDKITLFVDVNDKDRLDYVISRFSFRYTPSNHWNYWLKRWLLSFEDSDDETVVEQPLFKDTNTIKLETHEYDFTYVGNPSGYGPEWNTLINGYKLSFRLSKNFINYWVYGDGGLQTATIEDSLYKYMLNIARSLKSNSFELFYTDHYVQFQADSNQVFPLLNAYITTHPISVASVEVQTSINEALVASISTTSSEDIM